MLDRSKSNQFHYYQPGIGTYVTSRSLSHDGMYQRMKSAYLKAKDSAIGTSFDQHVMGGYKFLMRFYSPGDEIYFIGFSRGSYIARFLAEMLDYIGLLEAGNEELIRFAWKTFAKWQQRQDETEENRKEKEKLFHFMKAFRETFSRPISRIRFMGLFDTVNSVPKFESAWMERSRFPYTARTSAKVIRHAVGIDERRAKFRQDLISGQKPSPTGRHGRHHLLPHLGHHHRDAEKPENGPTIVVNDGEQNQQGNEHVYRSRAPKNQGQQLRYRPSHRRLGSLALPNVAPSNDDLATVTSQQSSHSYQVPPAAEDDEDAPQNIQEVWFPGGHADIGGGWKLGDSETWPLSHAPLVWMVQEAQRAGLQFDPAKLKQFECCEEFEGEYTPIRENWDYRKGPIQRSGNFYDDDAPEKHSAASYNFQSALHMSSASGLLHDCLNYGNGQSAMSVATWKVMEYLPFRRMDLQEDGAWRPIRWPLPCGEVRDIPNDAQIHVSAIRRLQADPNYRPGNLIVGGGGRGVRRAPSEYGIGEWVPLNHEGDHVRETYVRKSASKMCKEPHNG